MSVRRAAVLAPLALLSLIACSEADNGNNTFAYNKTEAPVAPSTGVGAPQSTAPARPGGGGGPGGALEIEAKDNEFVPKDLTAAAGDIVIEMENTGKAPHNWANKDQLNTEVLAEAGKTATIKLTGVKAGSYKFVCTFHETLGMVGTLTVT